ncbi:tRNA uridine 5-oxyacetic acid(34) methyltransferase CmoM [Xenorhabdus griffiniae]|uniref:tRNA 5-carboxymethoxyuridine methyltransferase n=1 Tax=Xenorhabdus griffiniae TaxID=351672 RepID=A0ABY9XDP6_9GAMM|nr:tRNA uridine 5-oxyacetic acid(34) methyltransferase CmoM [Xenorhabdus griffiniae]MBD1228789.1 tRNA uridine 5-oxyacetic acid(34) methyltransferase CmoM [Xenorhabdus griffiniae]MBE8588410.1 tRNA uridine 5-oxyacetic acid(34) methyltransferase CmoM [Xenorhabdus griffiniae]WMV71037.1 tRNA uridine 5-oxyacetic acid(34) methyltransferase CmoM [Xenorhabdus griffiniae]WNH00713.1 tRNA uridine 5-oxyacetic acid(34) methyltransferase CmoM [Xenorhabdus griffiniae]
MRDRNFDDIADKFSRNIYGTTKGKIRQAVVWQDINELLNHLPQRPLRILDAGGGEGNMACQLAELGHQVILCDLSKEMIQRAEYNAEERGVLAQMQFIQSPVQEIHQHIEQPVDLILFHAVLEWITDQKDVIETLEDMITPGGALSLMFYNANGLVMRNAILGNFHLATPKIQRRRKRSLSPQNPLIPEQVYQWLTELKMEITGKTGVRVFHDYLQSRQLQDTNFPALLELEQRYCRQEPYISLGRYIHVMARKPTLKSEL